MISRPRIAITMGDAAGIGPEIIVKSLAHAEVYDRCCPLVVGDASRLSEAVQRTAAPVEIQPVEQVSERALSLRKRRLRGPAVTACQYAVRQIIKGVRRGRISIHRARRRTRPERHRQCNLYRTDQQGGFANCGVHLSRPH